MKWIALLLFAISFYTDAFAQKIRFTDTSNQWKMLHINDGNGYTTDPNQAMYEKDTVIHGTSYHNLKETFTQRKILIREDTLTGKLFFRYLSDTLERLFFDYHFKIGDTLRMSYPLCIPYVLVLAIDSIQLGSVFYKRWNMQAYDFIEGIGSTNGPLFNAYSHILEDIDQLRCFTTNGTQPTCYPTLRLPGSSHMIPSLPKMILPIDSFDNYSSCIYKTLGVSEEFSIPKIVVSPNPGRKEISLIIPPEIHTASIRITDCTGRIIRQLNTTSTQTNIGQYLRTPGVYYYQVQDPISFRRYTGRFVFL